MTKRLILITAICLACLGGSALAGIVHNGSTSSEDSIPFGFQPLDSNGRPTILQDGDSITIQVIAPNGTLAYQDSIAYPDSRLTAYGVGLSFGDSNYVLTYDVADIDGIGANGVYKVFVWLNDQSLNLPTPLKGEFQLYNGRVLSSLFDLIVDEADSVNDIRARTIDMQLDLDSLKYTDRQQNDSLGVLLRISRILVESSFYLCTFNNWKTKYFPGDTNYTDSCWCIDTTHVADSIAATSYLRYNGKWPAGAQFIIWHPEYVDY